MASRTRVVLVLIFLAYPFFSIGVATMTIACGETETTLHKIVGLIDLLSNSRLGLVAAALQSDDKIVQIVCVFLLLVPISLAFLFILILLLIQLDAPNSSDKHSNKAQNGV
jgi:hypothetical protein